MRTAFLNRIVMLARKLTVDNGSRLKEAQATKKSTICIMTRNKYSNVANGIVG